MSQTGKRFLSDLLNRVLNTTSESKKNGRALSARRLGMEPLEERQLLSADPTLLRAFSDDTASVANVAAPVSVSVDSINLSNATLASDGSHVVSSDIASTNSGSFRHYNQGWAATLADLLAYTGWSDNAEIVDPESTDSLEQQTFDYIANSFSNAPTSILYAYAWFMGGADEYIYQDQTAYAQILPNNLNGGLYPSTSGEWQAYSSYMKEILASDIPSPLYGVSTEYLDNNYGVAVTVHYRSNLTGEDVDFALTPKQSTLTFWGYDYDSTYAPEDPEYYTAVYMSNPETGEVERMPVKWNTLTETYDFVTYDQTTGQTPYIYSFTVLQRMPGYGVLEEDAYEPNNGVLDFEAGSPSDLGKIDVIKPGATTGSTTNGNVIVLEDLTLYAEGNETQKADPVDFYKFELTQTASNSDSIIVEWADGVRYQNLKATLYSCSGNEAFVLDPTLYGHVAGYYDAVSTDYLEYVVGEDGKTYTKTVHRLALPLSGLTSGEYFLKVEFADDVVNGVNVNYKVTINAGFDDVYEANNSFEAVNELPVSTTQNPTANLGVLYGTTELSDLVLRQYSNVVDETDWYRFEMTETGSASNFINLYYNSTASNVNDADLDLYLYKYDPTSSRGYTLVAKSYVEMTNKESISLEGVDPGVYYIKVVGNYSAGNVEYKLEINPGVSDVPDLRPEVLPGTNWEAPLVVSGDKYVPNGSEVYENDQVVGVDSPIYLNYSFTVNGASKDLGADKTATYEGVRLAMYINGKLVDSNDISLLLDMNTTMSSTLKDKLYSLFCSDAGLDMLAGESITIRNLDLGRMIDEGSFANKYFDSYSSATNSIVIAINPDNYILADDFGKVVDNRETKEMTLTYKDGSFYNGATVVAISKGETIELYRNNRYLADVVYGVDNFAFKDGDIALVSVVSHQYEVNIDGAYSVKDGVAGVLEYTVDNNFSSMFFTVNDLSEDAFAPNGSLADVLDNDNPEDTNPDLGYANIDNLTAYETENGEIRYQRVIDNLVITGETNETGAYLSDWFRFNLKQSENDSVPNYKDAFIQIDMSDTLEGLDVKGNLGDLDLYLYRAVLTDDTLSFEEAYEQGAYTLELVQSSKGVGLQERISFSNLDIADGNYFICVSGFNGSANRYSLTLGGFTKSGDVLPTDPAEYFTEDSVTVLNSVATLNWRVPVDDYVSRVKIEYRAVGTSEWVEAGSFKPSVTSCKIAGLSSDTEYEFRMTVVNFFVEDDPLTATVTKTTDAFVNETVYRAVIVGVADYPGVAADLVAPVNDAKAFRDALLQDPQWAESNITMLVNSDATRDAVLDALAQVAEDSDDNDVFVFYFAGSGSSAVIGSQEVGYLKTCGSVRNEFISSSDLLKAVESIAAGSKQFVLDAGQISADAESTGINYAPFIESLTTSKINGGSERVAQTTVLTSGDDENLISPSGLGNRSVFNRALVDAMEKYLKPVTVEDVELAEEEAKNAKPGVVVEIPEISDGRVSFEELFAAIKADESVQLYSVGASLASNSEDETVLMSGLWNEADAFNDEWLENGAIVVTTTVDCVDAHDGKISLREAAALMGVQLENTVAVEENATFTLSAGSVVTIGTSVGYVVEDVQLVYANGAFRTSEACQLQTETTLLDFSRAGQGVTWTAEDWEDGKVTLVDSKDLAVNDLEFKLVGSVTIDGETAVFDLEDGDVLSTAAAEGEGREVTVKKVGQEYRLFVGEVPYTRLTGLYFNGEPIAISKGVELAQIETIKKVIFDPSLEGQTLELNATAGPIVFANGGAVIGSGAANPITLSGSNVHTLIRATGSETTTIVGLKLTNAGDSAIVVDEGASLELANCLLADSSVQDEAIIENNGYLLLVNDTIVNNKTNGFLVGGEGETTLKNTIVALNDADLSNLTYDATNVVGAADPGFVDAENGDYRLTKTSEALDIGQNSAVKLSGGVVIVSDLAGEDRIGLAGTVDAGAYEYTVALEDRETPSTVVTTLDDIVDATDGEISLREAIAYAGTTYNVDTLLKEGDVVYDEEGVKYVVSNGKLISFDGVSAIQQGQYYETPGVFMTDAKGNSIQLEEGDVVTLTNGSKATVVGAKLLLASGIPVEIGSTIVLENGEMGSFSHGATTTFMMGQQISVNLTAASISSTTPVATFNEGTYVLTYDGKNAFTATLNVTTTDESNQTTTSTFDATFMLVDGATFNFVDAEGGLGEEGSIVTTRSVEIENGKYTLAQDITETVGKETVVLYSSGAVLTLTDGVFTDVDGVEVKVPVNTKMIAPTGANITYQRSTFSQAQLEEGAKLTDENGVVRYFKSGLTVTEEVTLGTSITFAKGLESGTILLEKGALSIERAITLDATLNAGLTIDANGESRVFTVDAYRETNPTAFVNISGVTLLNGSSDEGGAIYVAENTNLRLKDFTIQNAQSTGDGGAIYNLGRVDLESTTKVSTIEGVSGNRGGAIYNEGTLTVTGVAIDGVESQYGAIYNAGSATLAGSTIQNANADRGGAVYNVGTLTISKSSEISNNTATVGAGLYNEGVANVVNSAFVGNEASESGGAVYNVGTLTITNAKLQSNVAELGGAAIYTVGNLLVNRALIADNVAYNSSAILSKGATSVVSSLILANGDESSKSGTYAVLVSGGTMELVGNTIVGNYQGGVTSIGGDVKVYNSIIGDNGGYDLNLKNVADVQYSMVDRSFQTIAATNLHYAPNFNDFDKSADWTQWNLRLSGSSIAVNGGSVEYNYYTSFTGKKTAITVDYAGNSRLTDTGVDVGAYSANLAIEDFSTVVTTLEDIVDPTDGLVSLREAIRYASYGKTVEERTVTFSNDLFALSDSAVVTLDADLQTIVVDCAVTITSAYTNDLGQTQYRDITIDGSASNAPLFIFTNGADVEMYGLTFANAHSSAANVNGGAIIVRGGSVSIVDSVVKDNVAERNGGAIYQEGGVLYVIDSLITGNSAGTKKGYGGAMCMVGGQTYIYNTTITANTAAVYGGVFAIDGLVVMANSIVAKNGGAQNVDVYATNFEATANLIGSMDPWSSRNGVNGNIVGVASDPVDPLFTNFEAGDYTLSSASLAINSGVNQYAYGPDGVRLKFDLNANERIVGSVVDMGAFESQYRDVPSTVVTTLADTIDQTDGFISLREALTIAEQFGSPITFDLGEDFIGSAEIQLNSLLGAIDVNSNIVIDASGVPGGLTLVGSDDRLFNVASGKLKLVNVSLTGGSATRGGAIYQTGGQIELTNVVIYDNEAEEAGGAIYSTAGSITMLNTTIAKNDAPSVPGVYAYGTVSLQNSIVAQNAVENGSAADNYDVYVLGKLSSTASIVGIATANDAETLGGANGNVFGVEDSPVDPGFKSAGTLNFELDPNSIAVNAGSNRLVGYPGYYASILRAAGNTSAVNVDYLGNDRIVGGTVDIGAYEYQIAAEAPSVVVTTLEDVVDPFDGLISLREAVEYAGSSFYVDGKTTVVDRNITFDSTLAGGTIELQSSLEITKCLTIDATYLSSAVTLTAEFAEEECPVLILSGVADTVADTITISGLKITGGNASYGGGVYHQTGKATLISCSIYGNEAMYGAGVASNANAVLDDPSANVMTLINCTVANNNATGAYGGVWSRGSAMNLYNTLIAKNTVNGEAGLDVSIANVGEIGTSLIGAASAAFARQYDFYGGYVGTASDPVDPCFVDVENNDFTLGRDENDVVSVAVNGGDSTKIRLPNGAVPSFDVDGNVRIVGTLVDIGAYESPLGPKEIPSLMVTTLDDVVDEYDGLISLREAVSYANNYGLASTITFAERLSGGTIYLDSSLVISQSVTIDGLTNNVKGLTITNSDEAGDQSIIYINAGDTVVNGVTLTNRYTERRRNDAVPTVEQGGAIYVRQGSIALYNSLITDTAAVSGSAIYVNENSDTALASLVNCTVVDNVGLSTDEETGAAIYSEKGRLTLLNTIVARSILSDNSDAQDVFKGDEKALTMTTTKRDTQIYQHVSQYDDDSVQIVPTEGMTAIYRGSTVYYDGSYWIYRVGMHEYQLQVDSVLQMNEDVELEYVDGKWYSGGVIFDKDFADGAQTLWTSVETGMTENVYYVDGEFRLGSTTGALVNFVDGDKIVASETVDYIIISSTGTLARCNYTIENGFNNYVATDSYVNDRLREIAAELQAELATQTTFSYTENGVTVEYPIKSASVLIKSYSTENNVTRFDRTLDVTISYTVEYVYETVAGVVVMRSIVERSDSLSAQTSGHGSFIGSATNDLSEAVNDLFVDADNGDYHLTNNSLATNSGDNSYFAQNTINGTYDTYDIEGNRRIYYTTVDMGAFENQQAKDNPITSAAGRNVTITVTTKRDVVDSNDGVTSMREALALADDLYRYGYENISVVCKSAYEIAVDSTLGSLTINSPITLYGSGSTIDAGHAGAGLVIQSDGEVRVSRLIIANGESSHLGAGVTINSGDATLQSVLIYGCESAAYGGGVYMGSTGKLDLYNVTITKNTALYGPGVYSVAGSTVNLYNTIVAQNQASEVGTVTRDVELMGDYFLAYSVIGSAGSSTDAAKLRAYSSHSTIGYGFDNAVDPGFNNFANNDFRLSLTHSAVKNTGSYAYVYPGASDLNGVYIAGVVSPGAYQAAREERSTIVTTLDDIVDPYDGLISLREAVANASDNLSGAGCGSVDDSSYNSSNAMNNASVYNNVYYSPITFDKSLAGGTIYLNSSLYFDKTSPSSHVVFDYLIDASALSGLGGITIDGSRIQGGIDPALSGENATKYTLSDKEQTPIAMFQILGTAAPSVPVYYPTHLDIRNVRLVGNHDIVGINVMPVSILTTHNCLMEGFGTSIRVWDNDSDQGGLAHIYNTTIIGRVYYGGTARAYNSIVTSGFVRRITQNNPGYRQAIYGSDCITYSSNELFVNASKGDYRLGSSSWATNRGNNDYLMTLALTHADPEVDLHGNPRVKNGTVDIGCFESLYADSASVVVDTELDVVDPYDGKISLREAIAYAEQFDYTVTFSNELNGKTIVVDSPVALTRDVNINGGSVDVTIDGNRAGSVFEIDIPSVVLGAPDVTLSNFTITGGLGTNGGAVNVLSGNVYFVNMTIFGNEATKYGGAVYAYDSELTFIDSRVGGNTATYYGGIVNEFGKTVLTRSYVAENVGTNKNATADVWGRAAVNYVNSKNNVVGSVADNVTLYDGVDGNRVGTKDEPLKPFLAASAGNLEVLPEFVVNSGAVLDEAFADMSDALDLDVDLVVLDDSDDLFDVF